MARSTAGMCLLSLVSLSLLVLSPGLVGSSPAEDELPDLWSYLDDNGYGIFSGILQTEPLLSAISSYLDANNSLTIFTPSNASLTQFAANLESGKFGKYCAAATTSTKTEVALSTAAVHIVTKFYLNDDLVALDFLTPLTTFTAVPLFALPQYLSSEVGSIQVGLALAGRESGIYSVGNIIEHTAYNSTQIIVHIIDAVLKYPVLNTI